VTFSVICCYNNPKLLRTNLQKSLEAQNTQFEFIPVANTDDRFDSIPKALNYGARRASGDYLMFVHQDVFLCGGDWVKRAQRLVESIENCGVAGVSGVTAQGGFKGRIYDRGLIWGRPISSPEEVQTLDEQLFIISRHLFKTLELDEGFRYHSYLADYCLRVLKRGLKVYVLPLTVEHNSVTIATLQAAPIGGEDQRLYRKHRAEWPVIYKTTGVLGIRGPHAVDVAKASVVSLLRRVEGAFRDRIKGDGVLLDLGCVPLEQLFLKERIERHCFSVGLSDKPRHIAVSTELGVHDAYIVADMWHLPLRERSIGVALLFSLLEYLPRSKGLRLLAAVETKARTVMVKIPNSGVARSSAYQEYVSKWRSADFETRGYRVRGLDANRAVTLQCRFKPPFIRFFLKKVASKFHNLASSVMCVKPG
jgi:hypothetical protein